MPCQRGGMKKIEDSEWVAASSLFALTLFLRPFALCDAWRFVAMNRLGLLHDLMYWDAFFGLILARVLVHVGGHAYKPMAERGQALRTTFSGLFILLVGWAALHLWLRP